MTWYEASIRSPSGMGRALARSGLGDGLSVANISCQDLTYPHELRLVTEAKMALTGVVFPK